MIIKREDAKELLPIVKALAEGKMIQDSIDGSKWFDADGINLEYEGQKIKHRIKPEPKYRPFNTQEECAKEMINHTPFGIITDRVRDFEIAIYPNGIYILGSLGDFYPRSFDRVLKEYKFVDGTPFGIKEE